MYIFWTATQISYHIHPALVWKATELSWCCFCPPRSLASTPYKTIIESWDFSYRSKPGHKCFCDFRSDLSVFQFSFIRDSVLKSGTKLCDARCKNPLQPPPHAAHSIRMIRGMSKFYLRIKRSQLRLFSLNIICLGGKYFHVFPIPKFS